jgi:N-acetyl-gamma-glutamyl-phosphate reductase
LGISIGILGATGYTGSELIRLLHLHPDAEITYLSSRQYNGKPISDVLEYLQGYCDRILEEFEPSVIAARCELVFSCLPHGTSMEFISQIIDRVKVIDLSADFRLGDAALYRAWYQDHTAPALLAEVVYGLSEVYRAEIRGARLVANPGCYPTSALLPLIPLLQAGIIETAGIIIDSKTGVSGAGRGLTLKAHICETGESFSAYKVGRFHRHIPEIEQELSKAAGSPVTVEFTPHLIPISRGMLSTIYVQTEADVSALRDVLNSFYSDSPFVKVLCDGFPATKDVRGTNRCIIGLCKNDETGRGILISAIDNLTKGASGQAVQNMNIMCGFPEARALDSMPLFP